jgi:hypothetical protein
MEKSVEQTNFDVGLALAPRRVVGKGFCIAARRKRRPYDSRLV